jgi:hypothetical protein
MTPAGKQMATRCNKVKPLPFVFKSPSIEFKLDLSVCAACQAPAAMAVFTVLLMVVTSKSPLGWSRKGLVDTAWLCQSAHY